MSAALLDESPRTSEEMLRDSRERGEWLAEGRELALQNGVFQQALKNWQLAIGDWLTRGVEKWSREAYADAADIFPQYTLETLRNFAYVSRRVETSLRNDVLVWSHYAAVARLKDLKDSPDAQKKLLEDAIRLAPPLKPYMPVRKFQSHVARKYPSPKKKDTHAKLIVKPTAELNHYLNDLGIDIGTSSESVLLLLADWVKRNVPDIAQKLQEAEDSKTEKIPLEAAA